MKSYSTTKDIKILNEILPFGTEFQVGLASNLEVIIDPKTNTIVKKNQLLDHCDSWEVLLKGEIDFHLKEPYTLEHVTFTNIPTSIKSAQELNDYIEKTPFDLLFPDFSAYLEELIH